MADFSTMQTAANLTDFVVTDDGKLAYITTSDGRLLRWDVEGKTFLTPLTLGGALSGVDISPDGTYLLVARSNMVNESGADWDTYVGHTIIDRVRTDTLAVTALDLTVTGPVRGVTGMALVGGNMAMLDNAFAGSGWVPLRYFSGTADTIPNSTAPGLAEIFYNSAIIPSADNRYVFITENLTSLPMYIYDTQTNSVVAHRDIYSLNMSGSTYGNGDINTKSNLVVNLGYGTVLVFDTKLDFVKDLGSIQRGGTIVGAQFTGDGEHLMFWDSVSDSLLVYETRSWSRVGTVALQSKVDSALGQPTFGDMEIAADGRTLFLDTLSGFEIVDLQSKLSISLTGGAGADTLYGSIGVDTLSGGDGNDILHGAESDDVLSGGSGDDLIDGGAGLDTASYAAAAAGVTVNLATTAAQATGAGVDTLVSIENLTGSAFADSLTGDGSANVFEGGAGDDILNGGDGVDTASYASAASAVNVNLSAGKAAGGAGNDTLTSIEIVIGSAYADSLTSHSGDSLLRGMAGDDVFYFGGVKSVGTPLDTFDGGDGMDMISVANAVTPATVNLTENRATLLYLSSPLFVWNDAVLISIEGIVGSAFPDQLTGSDGVDNLLIGGGGNDMLDGLGGADRLYGGVGNDEYHVDTQSDLLFELPGEGRDTVISTASFYLYENIEDLTLTGSENLFGVGNSASNQILGNGGANLLLGGDGGDAVFGGNGDDRIYGEAGDDSLLGGSGDDLLVGGAGNDQISGDVGADILIGGAGDDFLNGRSPSAEQDLMDGGPGDDSYLVDAANDLTFEAANGGTDTVTADFAGGTYYLYANVENLILAGTTANGVGNELDNVITGNASANWLLGGAGNDILDGKSGNDVLFGQDGADTFVFQRSTTGSVYERDIGADVIGDFTAGVDKVKLAGVYGSFAEVQAHMVQNGGDTAIDLGPGVFGESLVVFQHVAMSAFTAGDFLF